MDESCIVSVDEERLKPSGPYKLGLNGAAGLRSINNIRNKSEKHRGAMVAALRHMMRQARHDDAGNAGHAADHRGRC